MKIKVLPTPKQYLAWQALLSTTIKFVLFGGGAGGGKSWLGCEWLLSCCLMYPNTRWFIGRIELKRLRGTTLLTFYKVCQFYKISQSTYFKYHGSDHYIQFSNGSRIDLLDLALRPSDPLFERYGSEEFTGGFIEEGGEVNFMAFEVLKTRVGRCLNSKYGINGTIYISTNPKKNWLYRKFYKPWRDKTLAKDSVFIQALVGENEFGEKDYQSQLESLETESQKQRLLYGNWEYDESPDRLISYEDLLAALDVEPKPGIRALGVDIGWKIDDSVIRSLDGNILKPLKYLPKMGPTKVAKELEAIFLNRTSPYPAGNTRIDTVGLGAGTWTALNEKGYNCVQYMAGASQVFKYGIHDPKRDEEMLFANLRSQGWWRLRYLFKNRLLHIEEWDERAAEDITAIKYSITGEKRIQIEPKERTTAYLGRSPDAGDATMMAVSPVHRPKKIVFC